MNVYHLGGQWTVNVGVPYSVWFALSKMIPLPTAISRPFGSDMGSPCVTLFANPPITIVLDIYIIVVGSNYRSLGPTDIAVAGKATVIGNQPLSIFCILKSCKHNQQTTKGRVRQFQPATATGRFLPFLVTN